MASSIGSDGGPPRTGGSSPDAMAMQDSVAFEASPGVTPAASQTSGSASAGQVPLRLVVNGVTHSLMIDVRESLLEVLRERLDLTGTKKGCNQGACGACTVLLGGRRINSCLTLAAMCQDAQVTTIEGLATLDGDLHPLQAAFIACDAFQCGFCTAGQVMSGVACIAEGHATSVHDIRFWMSGNICRCGAYPGVVQAIADVAGEKQS